MRLLADHGYVVVSMRVLTCPTATAAPVAPKAESNLPRQRQEIGAPRTNDRPHLMTIKEFCTRAAISRSTAFLHIQRGDLKVIKIGRATRISSASIDDWLAKFAK